MTVNKHYHLIYAKLFNNPYNFFYLISTIHKDVSEKLKKIKPQLYKEVKKILDFNKSERHIRGGLATKHKYEEQKLKSNQQSDE